MKKTLTTAKPVPAGRYGVYKPNGEKRGNVRFPQTWWNRLLDWLGL